MAKRITIKANCQSLERVKAALRSLVGFYYLERGDSVSVGYLERRDASGNPESFYVIEFKQDGIEVSFTETGYEEAFRRWDVIKKTIPILSQVATYYNLDLSDILKIIDFAINDIFQSVPTNVKEELMKIEQLRGQINTLERKIAKLEIEKSELEKKLISLNEEYEKAMLKIKKYESLSDDQVREKIISWIKENNGNFEILEFSKFYNLPEQRVRDNLDYLIKEKYIKVIG
ncbi:MAG: hypothetical protein N3C61_01355 [Candidatus Micrarchaeota archaeon]|nr:hypothetical protein [Candidatus Micrarchaeota archaeon]